MGSADPYLAHRALIERAIAHVCRRHRLSNTQVEDFASEVRLHLLDRDCAVLRAYRGRSTIQTYLIAVIAHRFQDWRNAQWGKWRPSAEARRMGPLAMRLERLVVREAMPLDQACEMLRTNCGVTETRADLETMAARFPIRAGRQFTTDDALDSLPAPGVTADDELQSQRAGTTAALAARLLMRAMAELPAQDRLILRMRFDDTFRIADIARHLHLDQKALYRRFERLLAGLRARLEEAGLDADAVAEVLAHGGFDAIEERGETAAEVRLFDGGPGSQRSSGEVS